MCMVIDVKHRIPNRYQPRTHVYSSQLTRNKHTQSRGAIISLCGDLRIQRTWPLPRPTRLDPADRLDVGRHGKMKIYRTPVTL